MTNTQLTPFPVLIATCYEDGQDARHLTLEPLNPRGRAHRATPGQFFALSVPGKGEAVFTYVSLPNEEGRFDCLIRRVGYTTTAVFKKEEGTILGVRGPFGNGWPLAELKGKRVLLLAGGCGLAPLAGLVNELVIKKVAEKVTLVYGCRNQAVQILGKEREIWKKNIKVLETFESGDECARRIGTPVDYLGEAIESLGGEPQMVIVCGPKLMMEVVATASERRGIPPDHIYLSLERRMHCGVGTCGHCYFANTYICRNGPTYSWADYQELMRRCSVGNDTNRKIRPC